MTVYVEHLPRQAPARAMARLVSTSPRGVGEKELFAILSRLGLAQTHTAACDGGRRYALIQQTNVVRAMHAGAVPVDSQVVAHMLDNSEEPASVRELQPEPQTAAR